MKKILIVLLAIVTTNQALFAEGIAIGEETVRPLRFPKGIFGGEYNMARRFHGFADAALRAKLADAFTVKLGFEVGLYKYFNAGSFFSLEIPSKEPDNIRIRLALFAKPQIPIGERFSFFGRLGGGISAATGPALRSAASKDIYVEVGRVYKANYEGNGFGGHGSASLGFEYFFLSRFGISIEGGINVDVVRHNKIPSERDVASPNSLSYMTYDFPIAASLLIIF